MGEPNDFATLADKLYGLTGDEVKIVEEATA
jgi:hypothetical protein